MSKGRDLMPQKILSQKDYKRMKQEVVEEAAYGVGFFAGIFSHLPDYALVNAIKEIAQEGFVTKDTDDGTIRTILVTESIKAMNYQDFKDVAPYLFYYPLEQREADRLVQPIEISREYFEELKQKADELFYLKENIRQLQQRIDKKIEELETDTVPNGEQVIALDLENEELLLLRSPQNVYIDHSEIIQSDGLITDYRSSHVSETQTLRYLVALDNPAFRTLIRSDVLNRDEIDGYVQVDKEVITEVSFATIPDFRTHRQFYDYAKQFASFREEYGNSYSDYVDAIYERDYPTDFGLDFYSQAILQSRLDDFNKLLAQEHKELVLHTVTGYSQGDSWELAYIRDTQEETKEAVLDYLEHEVGAYYRGSLTELAVIKFENIDVETGFNGLQEAVYHIDQEELMFDPFEKAMERYPELARFTDVKEMEKQQEHSLTPEFPDRELGRSL